MRGHRLEFAVGLLIALTAHVGEVRAEPEADRILALAAMAPAFAGESPADLAVNYMMELPGSGGKGYVAEVRWSADGARRTALVSVGHVSLKPRTGWLATQGEWGLLNFHADGTWDDFIEGLSRRRINMNEMVTIGDLRMILSSQAAYFTASGGSYGELSCVQPGAYGTTFLANCLPPGRDVGGGRVRPFG